MNRIQAKWITRFVISCSVVCLALLAPSGVRVGADQPPNKLTEAVFVTSQTERGVFSQRLAEAEAARLRLRTTDRSAKQAFNTATPIQQLAQQQLAQQQLDRFTLTTTPQLEAAPQVKAAVVRALAKWDVEFETFFNIPVRVDFGSTLFGDPFPASNTVVVTALPLFLSVYPTLSGLLANGAFDLRQQALYRALPPDELPTELGPIQLIQLPVSLARVNGETVFGVDNPLTIGFNSKLKFDFDPRDGIDPDKLDFEALLLREVGRVLGFVSSAGSLEAQLDTQARLPNLQTVMIWDIFRFRNRVSLDDFSAAPRAQLSGDEQVFFAGGQVLALSTGRADGRGGDGRPAGHWKDDELTGQYLGIMDPTFAPGERGDITANDLTALDYFGYSIAPQAPVTEVLSNDDNSREATLALDGAMAVTRLVPGRYPCTVQAVRLQLPNTSGPAPVGKQIRLVLFADPARSGRPPANPPLLLDRTITIPALPENRMLEVMLPNGPALNAGDLYLGWQTPAGVLLAGDANVAQLRSFVTTDNGASFQPLRAANQQPVNLIARAVVTATFERTPVPKIASLSPTSAAPGGGGFKLVVYGQNFAGVNLDNFNENASVRWNGQARPTEFINGSLLQASIEDADVANAGTARVTVFVRDRLNQTIESEPVEVAITPNQPAPILTSLDPPGAPLGGGALFLYLRGRNFTPASVVKWNGSERHPDFSNSTELRLLLSKPELASAGNFEVVVTTPGPGGGASNKAVFAIARCHYVTSTTEHAAAASGGSFGILLNTDNYCSWTARSEVPWVTLTGINSGAGRGLLSYTIDPNYVNDGRSGTVAISDEKLNIRQSGFARAVSAASFTPALAPESIAALFSLGLGNSSNSATTTPLPTKLDGVEVRVRSVLGTTRAAPLFFTSPEQLNFQVPAGLTSGTATVFVYANNLLLNYGTVPIAPVAPGLFAANANGQGLVAAVALRVKADGTQGYEPVAEFDPAQNRVVARPLDLGPEGDKVFLLMFGTGIRGRSALAAVSVKIDGLDGAVPFAGAQGELFGLDQVNLQLPSALRGRGEVTINCTVDGKAANPVTVTIK